jgi:hypothetical protein
MGASWAQKVIVKLRPFGELVMFWLGMALFMVTMGDEALIHLTNSRTRTLQDKASDAPNKEPMESPSEAKKKPSIGARGRAMIVSRSMRICV